MKEEEERKRASEETRGVGFLASKRLRETVTDELADDVKAWLSVEDSETDSVSELLKLLDDSPEDTTSASSSTSSPTLFGMRVRFSDNPYSSALIFQSSSSYITINGNEESCGSSFSDSESSVMASVDMGGILNANVKVGSGLKGIRGREEAEGGGGTWDRSGGRGAWVDDGLEVGMGRRAVGEVSRRGGGGNTSFEIWTGIS
ncbi:uncharacterized protein LOC110411327 [Herrania umbratica]|uniref:Uncharacterized protein LOC110411327 n=1 Tax=Herrania umbratica TaxID=108875 RepID=A0A6J0ZR47_9ROSI|nr:uncharacterized protein LOC110411327 [Herrania umbratica]